MDISIVIVNYNTENLLRNCLASIRKTILQIEYEVIVVDNASRDGSVQMLEREHPEVRIIKNDANRGFGAANNQAFGIMKGRYALLLNTDTVLRENAVRELYSFMEDHPDAAMACGQLLNEDGSKQNSIAPFPDFLTLLLNLPVLEYLLPGRYPSKRYDHRAPIEVDSCIGACMMVRKKAIDEAGGFDERYFFFFEETDWALQMRRAGWKIYHVPSAFIYHLQGKSVGKGVSSRIEFYRSRYQYFRKWKGFAEFLLISIIIFGRLIVNWLLTLGAVVVTLGLKQDARDRLKIYSGLLLWHLRGCP